MVPTVGRGEMTDGGARSVPPPPPREQVSIWGPTSLPHRELCPLAVSETFILKNCADYEGLNRTIPIIPVEVAPGLNSPWCIRVTSRRDLIESSLVVRHLRLKRAPSSVAPH